MDKYNERPYYPYSWHQSHDQATVLLMVPSSVQDEDLSVIIDRDHLVITVKDHPPIVKGRIYGPVDTASSVWQLEPRSTRNQSPRERTISSASTASTHSSYAFVSSDPDISSSFAASLESAQASDAEDMYSPSPALSSPNLSFADDGLYRMPRRKLDPNPNPVASRSVSPGQAHPSMTSSFSSLDSHSSPRTGRLLTVHLEKEKSTIWPSLIVGPVPESLSSSIANTVVVFDASEDLEEQYNMDPTSLALIGLEMSDIRKDKEEAFEFFLRAWKLAHVPSATIRLVSHYLSVNETFDLGDADTKPARGTNEYYFHSIGGSRGLAQLYLEAGLLHLEGAASTLLAASYSSLSSIRIPLHAQIGEGGAEAWRRDREAAARFFESARVLHPSLDIPALPDDGELQLEMPAMNLAPSTPESEFSKEEITTDSEPEGPVVRRRRREKEQPLLDKTNTDLHDMDNAWYLYIPGIIGAGTAILVVGIVGALSFSNWSRRNQSS